MKTFDPPLSLSLPVMGEDQLRAIHAVLSSPVIVALVIGAVDGIGPTLDNQPSRRPTSTGDAKPAIEPSSAGGGTLAQESPVSAGIGETATSAASPTDADEIDANGHPWNPDLYASTKTKTKEGLWRLKVGATRPDPLPGFPKTDAGDATSPAASAGSTSTANAGTGSTQSADAAGASAGTAVEEDDEFAAFKAADQATQAAPVEIPPRTWTDADLSKLCNQAAQKLGNPEPVRELIAAHVPEGQVAHSRNIPDDQREAFAKAVEAKAEIEFVG